LLERRPQSFGAITAGWLLAYVGPVSGLSGLKN
jgi:hypothetical protein